MLQWPVVIIDVTRLEYTWKIESGKSDIGYPIIIDDFKNIMCYKPRVERKSVCISAELDIYEKNFTYI